MNPITSSGVPGLGDISWGTHFCHFYDSRSDLADTLVPFFKTGLENNEACLWVTCDPYSAAGARDELSAVVPDLAERERAGQIEIIDHDQWYLMHGRNDDARTTLQGWLDREAAAIRHGFHGLRLTGNTYWLERGDWDSFMAYERLVNQTFQNHRIIGLCSYCLSRCTPANVLDVVGTHQFAVSRRRGVWEVVEGSSLKLAREDLLRLRASEQALRESDRRKDEFLAMLAHELRNPLAPIRSGLELLTPESPNQQELLNLIQRQLQHLVRLVDDLLDVSRIMRGRIELRRECIDLAAVIQHAIEAVRSQIDDHGQHIEVSLPEEPVWIDADQVRMTQVLQNVVHNASKHSEPGGLIKIAVKRDEGDFVQINVRDYGSGIEPEMLTRIFELFVQTERSLDRVGGGLGIGLTLVQRLVALHGGTVAAHSDGPGHGSVFTIRLPVSGRAPETVAEQPEREAPSDRNPRERDPVHRRVLIVDDNVTGAKMLAMLLEKMGCGHVETAADGPSALARMDEFRPDLVLLDIGLPGMDGYEVARKIRANADFGNIMLVALTGYGQDDDRRKSMAAGMDAHLVKPASVEQIGAVLDKRILAEN